MQGFLLLYGHVSKSGICVNCYSYVTAEVVKTNNFLDWMKKKVSSIYM